MTETTFGYQIASLPSFLSNISSSSSILSTSTSIATVLANQNRLSILKWSVRIIGGLLIIIGGIGNTLSALTLSRKKLRAQVTSIYLIALALSDLGRSTIHFSSFFLYASSIFLGNVFFSVLNFYLVRLNPTQNMRLYSNLSCKFHMFFTYYFINLSPTLLVAVSVQRYLAIAKHHYSKRHCTVKNAYIVISLICFLSIFIQLHWGIFYELQLIPIKQTSSSLNRTITYRRICNVSSTYPGYVWFRSKMLGSIQWFLFTLFPFITMLILNSLILKVIASARRIQQRMNQKNQRKKAKQRNMTIMLLSVSCVFLLLTAPASTFMAFGHLFRNLHGQNSQSLWTMFSLIYYANTAANFILYFLTANVFRQELRVMIVSIPGCAKIIPQHSRLSQTNPTTTGAKLTTVGKTQLTTIPLVASAINPYDDEKTNGIIRKQSAINSLNINSTNRLLSVPNTVQSDGTSCNDDDGL